MGRRQAETQAPIPVAVVGLGDVGRAVLAAARARPELEVVGAADPALAGTPLSEVGASRLEGQVVAGLAELLGRLEGGVALVCTVSHLAEVAPTLFAAAKAGVSVVSTCETLAYPWLSDPELSDRLEDAFRRGGAACLGVGVNPGFVLDRLPATLGAVMGPVSHVLGRRTVDVGTRRPALQRKAGCGLDPGTFDAAVEAGTVGHVGLPESVGLVGEGLDIDLDEVDEEIDPVIAEATLQSGAVTVAPGRVAGIHQVARGFHEGREVIRLELILALGAEAPGDELVLQGEPPLRLLVQGGIPGEVATVNAVVRAVPQVAAADPGLLTVLDLPAGR